MQERETETEEKERERETRTPKNAPTLYWQVRSRKWVSKNEPKKKRIFARHFRELQAKQICKNIGKTLPKTLGRNKATKFAKNGRKSLSQMAGEDRATVAH